jgi:hypothetical protein
LSTSAQTRKGAVHGRVIDLVTKEAISEVIMYLATDESRHTLGTIANMNGEFHINNIEPGIYTLHPQCIGFLDTTIGPFTVSPDSNLELTFALDPYMGYTEKDATRDLDSGKIRLIFDSQVYSKEQKDLAKRYGFEILSTGCSPTRTERYNQVVIDYLKKRNGWNWYVEFTKEWDRIAKEESKEQ